MLYFFALLLNLNYGRHTISNQNTKIALSPRSSWRRKNQGSLMVVWSVTGKWGFLGYGCCCGARTKGSYAVLLLAMDEAAGCAVREEHINSAIAAYCSPEAGRAELLHPVPHERASLTAV
jgi:hypothetical protein